MTTDREGLKEAINDETIHVHDTELLSAKDTTGAHNAPPALPLSGVRHAFRVTRTLQ